MRPQGQSVHLQSQHRQLTNRKLRNVAAAGEELPALPSLDSTSVDQLWSSAVGGPSCIGAAIVGDALTGTALALATTDCRVSCFWPPTPTLPLVGLAFLKIQTLKLGRNDLKASEPPLTLVSKRSWTVTKLARLSGFLSMSEFGSAARALMAPHASPTPEFLNLRPV